MQLLSQLEQRIDALQDVLDFKDTKLGPHFQTKRGMGRMGLTGYLLGIALGLHLACLLGCWMAPLVGLSDPYAVICMLVSQKSL